MAESPSRPLLSRWFGPPWLPSDARGVGNVIRATAVARSSPPDRGLLIRAKSGPLALAFGVGHFSGVLTICGRDCPVMPGVILPALDPSVAAGVAHNPYPVPLVGSSKGGSRYTMPLRIVPERGKVGEDNVKPSSNKGRAVFNECVSGSYFSNGSSKFTPKSTPSSFNSATPAGDRYVLAGESSGQQVHGLDLGKIHLADVFVDGLVGPAQREYPTCVGVHLAEPCVIEPGPFQAQVATSGTGEEGADGEATHHPPPCPTAR
jgi:hypothetical protein